MFPVQEDTSQGMAMQETLQMQVTSLGVCNVFLIRESLEEYLHSKADRCKKGFAIGTIHDPWVTENAM